jgi:hypothetical protein
MQRVCRTPTPLTPLLFAFQAVLVLAGFGGVWLSVRGQHPYTEHISGWAIAVAVAVAIINVGATAWVNGRAGASGSDPAQRRWQAWKVIMVAAWIIAYATTAPHYHAGVSHPVWGLYPVSGPLLIIAAAGFGGPAGSWLIMGIGLCTVHLSSAAYTAWRQRRSMVRVVRSG